MCVVARAALRARARATTATFAPYSFAGGENLAGSASGLASPKSPGGHPRNPTPEDTSAHDFGGSGAVRR